jgi:hypothetical protein
VEHERGDFRPLGCVQWSLGYLHDGFSSTQVPVSAQFTVSDTCRNSEKGGLYFLSSCFDNDPESALALAQRVEQLARIYSMCLQCGDPAILSADEMEVVLEKFKSYGKQGGPAGF